MKNLNFRVVFIATLGTLLPIFSYAQGVASEIRGLRGVLETLYDEMIGMSSQLIGVAQGIAGFAATWYIAARVWRHIANAEPIDFYPLFRPFVLGFCIMIFPSVLALMNGILKPTVTGTAAMMNNSNAAIEKLLEMKTQAIVKSELFEMYVGADGLGDRDKWYKYTYDEDPGDEGWVEGIGNDIKFATAKMTFLIKTGIKMWLSELLAVLFEAAALCIDTLRTFQLIVLGILGPLVFGLAVFDGFEITLHAWIARYINIYLWLPVANIFGSILGKIQENMIRLDIAQIEQHGDTFFTKMDLAYLIFMIIGIVGYFTVPSVAGYIVQTTNSAMTQKTTGMLSGAADTVGSTTSSVSREVNYVTKKL